MSAILSSSLRETLKQDLGSDLRAVSPASGGDINDAYRIVLADGRKLFVKANRAAPKTMFRLEAEGLEYLRDGVNGSGVIVPDVVSVGEQHLVLSLLDAETPTEAAEEQLGRGIAALHGSGAPTFGHSADNFIGTLTQENQPSESWATFYGEKRLLAQMELAGARRHLDRLSVRRLHRLIDGLPGLVGPAESPARLHGDLWAGNWLATARGPALIDPAVYAGHREVDLAMMKLFGGYSERVFASYNESYPLADGWEERISLYQLYPLLVHVNLFGVSYVAQVERALNQYL